MYSDKVTEAAVAPAAEAVVETEPTAVVSSPTEPEARKEDGTTANETSDTGDTGDHRKVPLVALQEERHARKAIQAELRALRETQQQSIVQQQQRDQEYALAQQRLQQAWELTQQQPVPDETADPLAFMAYTAKQTKAQIDALAQQQWQRDQYQAQQQQQYATQQQQIQQRDALLKVTAQHEEAFVKQQPDYLEAVQYAKTRRAKELVAAGWTPENAQQTALSEAWSLAYTWLSQGMNPAERAYAMAKEMGYTVAEGVDKDAMREAGHSAVKASGGNTARGRISVAQIASMNPMQLARMSDDEFRAAMGG